MSKTIPEILQELCGAIERGEPITKWTGNNALKEVLKSAIIPGFKFLLPEGLPPFKQDLGGIGLTPSHLAYEARKFYVFRRFDLPALKRERLFIDMLESLHKDEVEVLLLIKEQELTTKYPALNSPLITEFISG